MLYDDGSSLTLKEVIHIRKVLTRAEEESLPEENHIKEDVQKRKVCFLCLKTRFGLFGPQSRCCKLCNRTICVRCCSKIKIPANEYEDVPIILLSPALLNLSSLQISSSNDIQNRFSEHGVTPHSQLSLPVTDSHQSRKPCVFSRDILRIDFNKKKTPRTSFVVTSHHQNRCIQELDLNYLRNTNTLTKIYERLYMDQEQEIYKCRGELIVVCHDCSIMLEKVIKTSRLTRRIIRNNIISHLKLDLSPVYI